MRLKFVCPSDFEQAHIICAQIRKNLPNLLDDVQIIRTNAQPLSMITWEMLPYVEKIAQPNWEQDIVLAVITARVSLADMEVSASGGSFDLLAHRDSRDKLYSSHPKIGGYYLPRNMPAIAATDIGYWVKVGMGELLHYFGIPEEHDGECI